MKKVVITGANGFVGKNLMLSIKSLPDIEAVGFDVDANTDTMLAECAKADYIIHLAGANRPEKESDFKTVNADLTKLITDHLVSKRVSPVVVLSSSIQAKLDNPYGNSKRAAEEVLIHYSKAAGAEILIYRLPNLFGKWCKPFYNSVVATFCHQVARNETLRIDNPDTKLQLCHIDTLVQSIKDYLAEGKIDKNGYFANIPEVKEITLGELARTLNEFEKQRTIGIIPDFSDLFTKRLWSTYLSYLKTENFVYQVDKKEDQRGYLFELIKNKNSGQIFVSKTLPGITRGNHYHHTKIEKFCVIEGAARISMRNIVTNESVSFDIRGVECKVIDIPPGWTHNIRNIGDSDLLTLFWANEIFDPNASDTYFEEV